jgi:hypothetical protein
MKRRQFLESALMASVDAVAIAAAVNWSVQRVSSIDPALAVAAAVTRSPIPYSPGLWVNWVDGRIRGDSQLQANTEKLGETIVKEHPQRLADLYRLVDETNFGGKTPHRDAATALAYLGWLGNRSQQHSFPPYIRGERGGLQSDGGIHESSNTALAIEMTTLATGDWLERWGFSNFKKGVDLMGWVVGEQNLALLDQKLVSGEYPTRLRFAIEGVAGKEDAAAKVAVRMGKIFETITTYGPDEPELTETQFIETRRADWYLDRMAGGLRIDQYFNQIYGAKPSLAITSGWLDKELTDDFLANADGIARAIIARRFDKNGVRGKNGGTAFGRIASVFDDGFRFANEVRYPLPEKIDAIVVGDDKIGYRSGSRVYLS